VLPFADGYGMEIGMTVDAVRAGYTVCEIELDLEHRATGRTLGGFVHRGRQLRDFTKVWLARR
jgi:glucosyl-3-phosphoglycerate synthase